MGCLWSSAGKAVGSHSVGRVSSVTLLAAGVLSSAGTVLWAGLGGMQCLPSMASLATDDFARDALSEGLCIEILFSGCLGYCLATDQSLSLGENLLQLLVSQQGLNSLLLSFFSQLFVLYLFLLI